MRTKKDKKKILHIGNIANNAYQNAKILNENGYDCDVLSYDYYHMMGCPEWDDAEIEGNIGNPNFPKWHRVNLNGFKRPSWFVSGPLVYCVKYLNLKNGNKMIRAALYAFLLKRMCKEIADSEDTNGYLICKLRKYGAQIVGFGRGIIKFVKKCAVRIENVFFKRENFKEKRKYFEGEDKVTIRAKVEKDFATLFPDRENHFGDALNNFISVALLLKPILNQYDYVFAYATNPVIMYLAGIDNYIAYEHGTIRDLPYEDSDMGRLMLLSYAKAKAIYSTNLDCYDSAKYIVRNTGTPIVCGLHGLDIDRIIYKIEQANRENMNIREVIGVDSDKKIFFCPSRHSWDNEKKLFLKGEDKMLVAANKLAQEGYDFHLILIEWGDDCAKIKNIINNLVEVKSKIHWIQPIPKNQLYFVYQNVDAVIDQFYWRAYGAITFEVLASNHSALISNGADENYQREYFGDLLPYFACNNENDIYHAMYETIIESSNYKRYTNSSLEWIKKHHSKEDIYMALLNAIRICDESRG